jgi:hypothetical protein
VPDLSLVFEVFVRKRTLCWSRVERHATMRSYSFRRCGWRIAFLESNSIKQTAACVDFSDNLALLPLGLHQVLYRRFFRRPESCKVKV